MTNPTKLVPVEPTEEQWSGFARKVVMWIQMQVQNRLTPKSLLRHLELTGVEPPDWLMKEGEMETPDHAFSKGTLAAIIYRAMIEDAPEAPPQAPNEAHRWNIERTGETEVLVCRGEHEKGYKCEYERWVPEDQAQAPVSGDFLNDLFDVLAEAPELNPSNYDHEQVCELNAKMVEAYQMVQAEYERKKQAPVSGLIEFNTWLCTEMPPGTVIGNPEWWSQKIWGRLAQTTQLPMDEIRALPERWKQRMRNGDIWLVLNCIDELEAAINRASEGGE